jgi:hypothetical protein
MTAVTMLLLARKGGLTRFGAILLVALYVGFLVVALS